MGEGWLPVSKDRDTSLLPFHGTEFCRHLNEQGNGSSLSGVTKERRPASSLIWAR